MRHSMIMSDPASPPSNCFGVWRLGGTVTTTKKEEKENVR